MIAAGEQLETFVVRLATIKKCFDKMALKVANFLWMVFLYFAINTAFDD